VYYNFAWEALNEISILVSFKKLFSFIYLYFSLFLPTIYLGIIGSRDLLLRIFVILEVISGNPFFTGVLVFALGIG